MKIVNLFILLLFLSCSQYYNYSWYNLEKLPIELSSIHGYSDSFKISQWINDNVKYKLYANGFHSAQKTLDEKEGNCANQALLELALYYKLTGVKGNLYYGWLDTSKQNMVFGLHYRASFDGLSNFTLYETIEFDKIAEYIYYRQ